MKEEFNPEGLSWSPIEEWSRLSGVPECGKPKVDSGYQRFVPHVVDGEGPVPARKRRVPSLTRLSDEKTLIFIS